MRLIDRFRSAQRCAPIVQRILSIAVPGPGSRPRPPGEVLQKAQSQISFPNSVACGIPDTLDILLDTRTTTLALDDAFLPATLAGHPMSDDEFAAFCTEHLDLSFEMSAEGEIIRYAANLLTDWVPQFRARPAAFQWALRNGRGIGCDSSTGFVFPNGARCSPAAA